MNVATTNLYIFFSTSKNHLTLINLKDHLGHKISWKNIAAMATSLLQRLFVSNRSDKVASDEEQEVTTNNNGQETQTQMTLAQDCMLSLQMTKMKKNNAIM